mgnify:FL=1
MKIDQTDVPPGSLIAEYAARDGHYADCFEAEYAPDAHLSDYITAFYTQPLFRAERLVLRVLARAPSTGADVAALAAGEAAQVAVWRVQGRTPSELLMIDKGGRTLSWLAVGAGVVRFGSVVVPVPGRGGKPTLGPVFQSLVGAHKVYSRALLAGAVRRVT